MGQNHPPDSPDPPAQYPAWETGQNHCPDLPAQSPAWETGQNHCPEDPDCPDPPAQSPAWETGQNHCPEDPDCPDLSHGLYHFFFDELHVSVKIKSAC